ncbi:hypothetical protein [Pseudothermotoga sp.]|nr:hypothetical protein [Pseudothermotoga sp.]MCX7813621.1 hypothetical protein [Pseudothermotoga sp.]MDW8139975.1 hypothetical protein [Pseudothermotoga sp.]
MIVCIFVESPSNFKEKVRTQLEEQFFDTRYLETEANVDKLTELLFEHAQGNVELVIVLGGVDIKTRAISSIAVERIVDGRIYTLEKYLCQLIAESCPECLLTSPTVGVRNQTLIVSLPNHDISLKLLNVVIDAVKKGG